MSRKLWVFSSTGQRELERADHHGGGESGRHHQGGRDAGGQGSAGVQAQNARNEKMRV